MPARTVCGQRIVTAAGRHDDDGQYLRRRSSHPPPRSPVHGSCWTPTVSRRSTFPGRGAGYQGQRARSTVRHTSHRPGCQTPPATCAGLRCACAPASMVRRQGNHDSPLPVLHTSALPKGSPFPANGGDGQQFWVTAAQHLSYARPLAQSGPSGPARCRCERRTSRRVTSPIAAALRRHRPRDM